jgi:aryl-alcohol dehydrogenase-like predicted oxidoreductase
MPAQSAGHERRSLEASLLALGLEYVDLWLIHGPRAT